MAKKRKSDAPIVVDPDKWYAMGFGAKPWLEECCDCGLVHRVEYKVEGGRFWIRWQRDEVETAKAHKRMNKDQT